MRGLLVESCTCSEFGREGSRKTRTVTFVLSTAPQLSQTIFCLSEIAAADTAKPEDQCGRESSPLANSTGNRIANPKKITRCVARRGRIIDADSSLLGACAVPKATFSSGEAKR